MKLHTMIGCALASTALLTGCSESVTSADLDRVLDVTADTLYMAPSEDQGNNEEALQSLVTSLQHNFNKADPKVHEGPIGVNLQSDGSFLGFQDKNTNNIQDSGEAKLFTVEIDAEKERLIATDVNNTVRDHSFSGTSLLAGYLLGSLLSRQKAAGVNPSAKQATPKAAYQNARARSGSGSHTTGK